MQDLHLHKTVDEDGQEARLYCYSEQLGREGTGHVPSWLRASVSNRPWIGSPKACPGRARQKRTYAQVWQRIGRLKQQSPRRRPTLRRPVVRRTDETGNTAVAGDLRHQKTARIRSRARSATHPGVYMSPLARETPLGRGIPTLAHLHPPQLSYSSYLEAVLPLALKSELDSASHLSPIKPIRAEESPVRHRHRLPTRPGHRVTSVIGPHARRHDAS